MKFNETENYKTYVKIGKEAAKKAGFSEKQVFESIIRKFKDKAMLAIMFASIICGFDISDPDELINKMINKIKENDKDMIYAFATFLQIIESQENEIEKWN